MEQLVPSGKISDGESNFVARWVRGLAIGAGALRQQVPGRNPCELQPTRWRRAPNTVSNRRALQEERSSNPVGARALQPSRQRASWFRSETRLWSSSSQRPLGFVHPRCTHPPRRKAVIAHPSSLDCFIHEPTPRRRRGPPPKSRPNRPHPIPLRHHPHLRRWQHMTGMSETDSCRLCAEEEESSEHLWLRCPSFIAERQRLGLSRTYDELVRLPCASLALLRVIFRRLRWLHNNNDSNNNLVKKLSLYQ